MSILWDILATWELCTDTVKIYPLPFFMKFFTMNMFDRTGQRGAYPLAKTPKAAHSYILERDR
ncbi:hypothetical protein A3I56_03365 [Candidatus Roizmanbacteria bacterium RIFCSPLOWO2_02_FULL_43_10]|uniref:Uncharacterized protein n=1 Tax=Candidatus Roizmanbacteria bacterium RIFCSPLOWO2_02_FULL_43_10 TaxID=1802078 RepID=A0A1F7JW83_9BACT|nr:MAG: hypothetical protein A3I56_03365 [Candidatus Roizmanbacteria bacterium RIFCSPLOWO2_02_FULL_43_10]